MSSQKSRVHLAVGRTGSRLQALSPCRVRLAWFSTEPKTHYFQGYGQAAGRPQFLVRSACLPAALPRRQPGLWTKEEVCAGLRKESHAACESCHGGHASLAVLTSSESHKAWGTHGPWVKDMGWAWFHQHLVSKVNCSGGGTHAELETDQMQYKRICGGLAAVTGGVIAKDIPPKGLLGCTSLPLLQCQLPEAPDYALPSGFPSPAVPDRTQSKSWVVKTPEGCRQTLTPCSHLRCICTMMGCP